MSEPEFDPVECPVVDCDHRGAIRSVAAHVSGTDDAPHSWDRLGFEGARDFVMVEKHRQLSGDKTVPEPTPDKRTAGGRAGTSRPPAGEALEPFELGFERDALLVCELVREYDFDSLVELDTARLVNLYSLLADLRKRADGARKEVRDALLEAVHDDRVVPGDYGTVRRQTYTRRQVKDDETVLQALHDAGVEPESVRSFDTSKLRDAVEETTLDSAAIFDIEERAQIRIADSDDEHRRSRFDRLPDDVRAFVTNED